MHVVLDLYGILCWCMDRSTLQPDAKFYRLFDNQHSTHILVLARKKAVYMCWRVKEFFSILVYYAHIHIWSCMKMHSVLSISQVLFKATNLFPMLILAQDDCDWVYKGNGLIWVPPETRLTMCNLRVTHFMCDLRVTHFMCARNSLFNMMYTTTAMPL
jgi:hypothetical protein